MTIEFKGALTAIGQTKQAQFLGGASTISTNAIGGGQAHPNVQPTIIRNVIIKL